MCAYSASSSFPACRGWLRYADLADVVQVARDFQRGLLFGPEVELPGDGAGVGGHPVRMTARVVVLRIDRRRQRPDGRDVALLQRGHQSRVVGGQRHLVPDGSPARARLAAERGPRPAGSDHQRARHAVRAGQRTRSQRARPRTRRRPRPGRRSRSGGAACPRKDPGSRRVRDRRRRATARNRTWSAPAPDAVRVSSTT